MVYSGTAGTTEGLTNTVYGTLPFMSSGGPVPGVNRVVVTQLSSVDLEMYETGVDLDVGGANLKFHGHHIQTSIVQTDQLGPYSLSLTQANSTSKIETLSPYKYDLLNMPAGTGPTVGNSVAVTIGFVLKPPPAGFSYKAGLSFSSARLACTINLNGWGGPAPGLKVWDPVTGTVFASDPNFTGIPSPGTGPMGFTVPASATESIQLSSGLAIFPDGNFNAISTAGTAEIDYLITVTIV